MFFPAFETSILVLVISAVLAYGVGALPIGRCAAKRALYIRPNGKTPLRASALVNVVLDQAKGFCTVLAVCAWGGVDAGQIAVLAVFLGHQFPPPRTWSGGAGTGTLVGALVALDPNIGLIALLTWFVAYRMLRRVKLALLASALTTSLAVAVFLDTQAVGLLVVLSAIICWQRRDTIMGLRLQDDQEHAVEW